MAELVVGFPTERQIAVAARMVSRAHERKVGRGRDEGSEFAFFVKQGRREVMADCSSAREYPSNVFSPAC